jgi:hypothetical protein
MKKKEKDASLAWTTDRRCFFSFYLQLQTLLCVLWYTSVNIAENKGQTTVTIWGTQTEAREPGHEQFLHIALSLASGGFRGQNKQDSSFGAEAQKNSALC